MAMNVGQMMVVIRAEDYASRTLRRVGAEMRGMSRDQIQAQKQMRLTASRIQALNNVRRAEMDLKPIRLIQRRNELMRAAARDTDILTQAQRRLNQSRVMEFGAGGRMLPRSPQQQGSVNAAKKLMQEAAPLQKSIDRQLHQATRLQTVVSSLGGSYMRMAQSTYAFNRAQSAANQRLATAHAALDDVTKRQLAFNAAQAQMPHERMARFGHALSGVARTMQLFGAVAVAGLGVASAKFADFSKEVTLAATQTVSATSSYKAVGVRAAELRKEIVNLMQTFPATGTEMAKAAYDIYSSMTISFGGGIDLLTKFNKLAVATGTDLETATSAGITVLNNFGGSAKNIDKTLNLMVATVRYGRMRLEDFNAMLNKVAPAAASAGLGLEDVAGAMALVTRLQPSQREVATGLSRLLKLFQDPDFQEGARKASGGMVELTKEGGGLKPLLENMQQLVGSFGGIAKEKGAVQLFRQLTAVGRGSGIGKTDTIQAQRAFVFLATHMKQFEDVTKDVKTNYTELQRALQARMEDPGVRMDILMNQLRALALVIGEKAIPVFLQLGDYIQKGVRWFQNLSDSTKESIVRFAAFGSIGLVLAGIVLGIAGPIVAMMAHLKAWRIASAGAAASTLTLATAMKFLPLGVIGVILTQVVGLERAIKIMALGWVAWKVTAMAAAAAVAVANAIAARAVRVAWTSALVGTGIGAFVIASGLAAEYIINHWTQVKDKLFQIWDALRIRAAEVALQIIEPFTRLPDMGIGLGDNARQAAKDLNTFKDAVAFGGDERRAMQIREQVLDRWLKKQPKMFAAARKDLQRQNKAGMLSTDMKPQLDEMNAAWKRASKDNQSKGKGFTPFSEDVWKVSGKNAEAELNKLFNAQIGGAETAADKMKNYRNEMKRHGESLKTWREDMKEHGKAVTEWRQDYAKQVKQWGADLVEETGRARQQAVSNLQQMYQGFEEANRTAMGALFQGPHLTGEAFNLAKEWGVTAGIEDMIKDLDMSTKRFRTWQQTSNRVLAKGVPREFVDEMKKMGVEESQPLFEQILAAKPGQVQNLIRKWREREGQIKSQTKMDFADEIKRFRKAGTNMGDAIINGFTDAGVGVWFDGWIKAKFPNLINAAVTTAVANWKKQTPLPEMPDRPEAPKRPTAPVMSEALRRAQQAAKQPPKIVRPPAPQMGGRTSTSTTGDTYNITVNAPGTVKTAKDIARRTAWEIKNGKKAKTIYKDRRDT